MTREKIAEIVNTTVADVFMLDAAYVAQHPELNFRTDLNAISMQYFPLITELEDQLDIEVESHEFQSKAPTVNDAIDFVTELVGAQK